MLPAEARWLARVLTALPESAFPLLNVGSQTLRFRSVDQPYIDSMIFAPLRRLGRPVLHSDIRVGDGVDVVGDLCDPQFLARLEHDLGVRSVVCSNLLEHVGDPMTIIASMVRLVSRAGGHLLITGPRSFPYHPDPIDTMFRPSPSELARLMAPLVPLSCVEMRAGWLASYSLGRLLREPSTALSNARAAAAPPVGPPRRVGDLLPWAAKPFTVTCGWFTVAPSRSLPEA